MKYYRLLLFSTFFLMYACGSDDDGPSITINAPSEIRQESNIALDFSISDESLILSYTVKIMDNSQELFSIISTPEVSKIERSESVFISTNDSKLTITINAEDEYGNTSQAIKEVDVTLQEGGSLLMNFKLQYGGSPLVMFTPLTYLSGETITFTRVSSYVSDIALNDTNIKEIDFLRLDDGHLDDESALNGFDYEIGGIPSGTYDQLSFRYGISAADNANKPSDYPSGHPLAAPGEYWVSWNSYIFVKIEGRMDTDGDGALDEGFALHLGSDEAARVVELEYPFSIENGGQEDISLTIDLKEVLGGENAPYNLIEDGQIHSLNQIPLIRLLAENLKINTKN